MKYAPGGSGCLACSGPETLAKNASERSFECSLPLGTEHYTLRIMEGFFQPVRAEKHELTYVYRQRKLVWKNTSVSGNTSCLTCFGMATKKIRVRLDYLKKYMRSFPVRPGD